MKPSISPLNRDLQRELLHLMRNAYPECIRAFPDIGGYSESDVTKNLIYLEQHGLCNAGLMRNMDGTFFYKGANISAQGLDFLEDDGGLSAILGVVTIKIHDDTILSLIRSKIESDRLPDDEKSRLTEALGKLSEEGLKATVTNLVRIGLEHAPNLLEMLRKASGF